MEYLEDFLKKSDYEEHVSQPFELGWLKVEFKGGDIANHTF